MAFQVVTGFWNLNKKIETKKYTRVPLVYRKIKMRFLEIFAFTVIKI